MRFDLFASMFEEANSGWVWLREQPGVKYRKVVKIHCPSTRKKVWCEARIIDD